MDYIFLALSWAIFYSLHSILAASKLKRILEVKLDKAYKWYRLFYSLFSIFLFLGIIVQSLFIPGQVLLPNQPLFTYAGYMISALGVSIALSANKQISFFSFLGFNPKQLENK